MKEINVSISRTINMGNFNSLKVTAGLGTSVADDANLQDAYKEQWNAVNTEIERAIRAFQKRQEG
ncbi:MAG: hypothetical protein PHX79_03650 [Sphaerochaetaceae bacterium]|jgi:hypothetical protein|nr:hypothetical protein [Sphaerochaetaceae bacterium]